MGVNSKKPGEPPKPRVDKRVAPYDAIEHFDEKHPLLCHARVGDLDYTPYIKKKKKPTSNNLKLDELGGEEKKFLKLTMEELLSIDAKDK